MDWQTFIMIVTDVTVILTLISMLVPPIRKRILGQKAIEDGQRCLLRSEIVKTYYRNVQAQTLRQYEYENLCSCYDAYIALGGNSFVKRIYQDMQDWKVVH